MTTTSSPVIVALDFPSATQAMSLTDRLSPTQCRLKIGKELFTREGPAIVRAVQGRGFEVFLDLEFHDIPNTTAAAVMAAADLGVWMVNVHASGGRRMMQAAANGLQKGNLPTLLIAVTVLTSMEAADLAEVGISGEPLQQVERLALLTQDCGLHGVVCSAQEAGPLRRLVNPAFQLVTPGIRLAGGDTGDQRRIMTPEQAQAAGVSYMVIGRPITQSADPLATLIAINKSLGVTA